MRNLEELWKQIKGKYPNLWGYSGSLQPRIKGGKIIEGTKCFRIYVTEKEKHSLKRKLKLHEIIPKTICDIETDIVEIGEIKSLELTERDKHRPVPMGVSAMHYEGTACTVGILGRDNQTNRLGIIANNHCTSLEGKAKIGDAYIQPSKYDGGTLNDRIASLAKFVPINFEEYSCPYRNALYKIKKFFIREQKNIVDVGFCLLDSDNLVKDEIFHIGKVYGVRDPQVNDVVQKTGRTTSLTRDGKVIDVDWRGYVQYSRGRAWFEDCALILKDHFSERGDSIAGDSEMFYQDNGKLCYDTVSTVYEKFLDGHEIKVLSSTDGLYQGRIDFRNVTNAWMKGLKDVWEVKVSSGRAIKLTKDHSLFKEENGKIKPISLSNIKVGDSVLLLDNFELEGYDFGNPDWLMTLAGLWVADGCYERNNIMISTGFENDIIGFLSKIPRPTNLTEEIARMIKEKNLKPPLLSFAREMKQKYGCSISATYDAWKRLPYLLSKKKFCNIKIRKKGDVRLYSYKLKNILQEKGFNGDSYTKRVPRWLFVASKREIRAFLRGYFSGDGSYYLNEGRPVIEVASVSFNLLRDIQILLGRVGIRSCIGWYLHRNKWKGQWYGLKIEWRKSLKKFLSEVGFIKDISNVPTRKMKERNENQLSIRKVKSVKYVGREAVYDFEVNPTQSFVANGFLCHNSSSAIVTQEDYPIFLGLLFAGSGQSTIFCKSSNIERELNVKIVTNINS